MNELYGEFKMSDRDTALQSAAERYVRECEQYDLTVCSGPVTVDGIMPVSSREFSLSSQNSRRVLEAICAGTEFSRSEIIRAASKIDPRSVQL